MNHHRTGGYSINDGDSATTTRRSGSATDGVIADESSSSNNDVNELVYDINTLNTDSPDFSQPDEEANQIHESYNSSTRNESEFKLAQKEIDENDEQLSRASIDGGDIESTSGGGVGNGEKSAQNQQEHENSASENKMFSSLKQLSVEGDHENEADESIEMVPIEQTDEWRTKSKHIFILSEAGKPIYSLHGNEVQLITLMGLLQALVSVIECDNANKLKYVVAGEHKIVFMHVSHLILVCVSNEPHMCVEQLEMELAYCYNQIVSVVTLSYIDKIFTRHRNYDLRNKLTGTEKLLTNIVGRLKNDYGMLLNCVNSYPLPSENRDQVSKIIAQQINPIRYVIFGLLLFDNKLVSLIRPKAKNIHPVDVHLLVNVITGLDTPKSAEFTWYPICLPNFDSNGLAYAYISHLDETCRTCLILLSGMCDQDQSYELNECRKRIQTRLQQLNIIQLMSSKSKDSSLRLDQIGITELKHFLFKDNSMFQYFVSDYALPHAQSSDQQQHIFNMYQRLYHKLHNKNNGLKIIYMQQKYETILGWMTSGFEIYATFSPLVTKSITICAINKLLEFTQKNRLKIFLNAMPTLQR